MHRFGRLFAAIVVNSAHRILAVDNCVQPEVDLCVRRMVRSLRYTKPRSSPMYDKNWFLLGLAVHHSLLAVIFVINQLAAGGGHFWWTRNGNEAIKRAKELAKKYVNSKRENTSDRKQRKGKYFLLRIIKSWSVTLAFFWPYIERKYC